MKQAYDFLHFFRYSFFNIIIIQVYEIYQFFSRINKYIQNLFYIEYSSTKSF